MSAFANKHKSDVKLLLSATTRQLRATQPQYADAFERRVADLEREAGAAIDRIDAIRSSGRYSADGERAERLLVARTFAELTAKLRNETVDVVERQRADREAELLNLRKAPRDATDALLHELRLQEVRRDLRTLDPLMLVARLKTSPSALLLEAIETDPLVEAGGASVAPLDVVKQAREAAALAADPTLGELAQLRDNYSRALGACEATVLAAVGLTSREVTLASSKDAPDADARKPYVVSTGHEVDA
jgi:hypothetical protein